MIGVIAQQQDHKVLREFFELFKVPWEFFHQGSTYPAVLITTDEPTLPSAGLILHYSSLARANEARAQRRMAEWNGDRLPLYGHATGITGVNEFALIDHQTRTPLGQRTAEPGRTVVRIGYDLCHEVRHLLTKGQPLEHASIPTLELHISILRQLIVDHGLPLVEIRPCPAEHPFMVCLTHDVDHPSLLLHRLDSTTAGFLYRATAGSLVAAFRRRIPWQTVWRNWLAALKLPLVHLRLARDFWLDFAERFLAIEHKLGSTYFFIPRKAYPGVSADGSAPAARASGYQPADIATTIERLRQAGCEVGLHGIDAWQDRIAAKAERQLMASHTSPGSAGIRMHWLYFDENSPRELEAAGFAYDSTFGYNETIGFRAGTTQVYQPLETDQLLELPLHVMDTALFYPDYLNLTAAQAMKRCREVAAVHATYGGALTVNWHDRSVAPERCWDTFYVDLLNHLRRMGAWFPTAGEAVAWFRLRRTATIELTAGSSGDLHLTAGVAPLGDFPALCVRLHNLTCDDETTAGAKRRTATSIDLPLKSTLDLTVSALAPAAISR